MQIPTPLEFSLYVLTEAEKVGGENLNPHWQSQWGCCPFCTLDFDIIGHLETFKADMDFIIKAMHWEVSDIMDHPYITSAHFFLFFCTHSPTHIVIM